MARNKGASPTLKVTITEESYKVAVRSKSGGCLVSDAIERQYPHLKANTDMATIRITDSKAGESYVYLTPGSVQHVLLAFDQGWRNPFEELTIRRAVQILPIKRPVTGPSSPAVIKKNRAEKLAEFTARIEAGEDLTSSERRSFGALKAHETRDQRDPVPERPSSLGPAEVVDPGSDSKPAVIRGGKRRKRLRTNPNLLTGRNRHFGAKLADPGLAFREAVAQAVDQELASRAAAST
jgi:predicted CopG family antitoxin